MTAMITARLYSGYAGWSAGQLSAEISAGGWIVTDLADTDPFYETPEELWTTVLSRQKGLVSKLAQYPDDPRMN